MNDVIIIGGGVAAFSAAIYSARRGLATLVIGKDLGGQANSSDLIENYPGLAETGGLELVLSIRQQAEKFGAKTLFAEVAKISAKGGTSSGGKPFFVVTAYGQQFKCTVLILAYGKTPMDLAVSGEEEFKGKGVSYCVTCDAALYRGKDVAVVGIGDLNLDAALMASKYAKKVYLLCKTDKLIGHPALLKAVLKKPNIELVSHVQIEAIEGDQHVRRLKLKDFRINKTRFLNVEGVFVELGFVIHSDLVKGLVDLDELDQIKVDERQATSYPGIFAAGDCTNRHYKQAVISAGEGAAAALAAYDWLMRQKGGQGLTSDWTQIKRIK